MTKRKANPEKRGPKPGPAEDVMFNHTIRFTEDDWADILAQGGAAYIRRLYQEDKERREREGSNANL